MAKKSGGSGREKFNGQAMAKVADIRIAAKSLAVPRSYEKGGYPAEKGTLHINNGNVFKASRRGED